MGAHRRGQEEALALPWKMYKARFASIVTFWFAQKEPKSLLQDMFHRFNIDLSGDCGRALPQTTLGGDLQCSPILCLSCRRKGRVDTGEEGRVG